GPAREGAEPSLGAGTGAAPARARLRLRRHRRPPRACGHPRPRATRRRRGPRRPDGAGEGRAETDGARQRPMIFGPDVWLATRSLFTVLSSAYAMWAKPVVGS